MAEGSAQPAARNTSADDLPFKEWQECRSTMGRLDTILVDLRKLGFSLITGLLTASAFVGFVGVSTAQNVAAPPPEVRAAAFIATMILVAALFSVDTYYQVLLSGAAERALDLEAAMTPPLAVTKYLSSNATASRVGYVTVFLYLILLAAAESLGLLGTGGVGLGLWAGGLPGLLGAARAVASAGIPVAIGIVVGVVLALVVWQGAAGVAPRISRQDRDTSLRAEACVVVGLTAGLDVFLVWQAVGSTHAAASWVALVGLLLALYIELYWLFVSTLSGLHRLKPGR